MSATTYISMPEDMARTVEENNILLKSMMAVWELGGVRCLNSKQAAKYIGKSYSQFMQVHRYRIKTTQMDDNDSYDVHDLVRYIESCKQKKIKPSR